MKIWMDLEVFFDDKSSACRFKKYDQIFSTTPFNELKDHGEGNPQYVDKLVRYDKPDIILVKNKKPVLVLEITREAPSGHNHTQRYGRIACASEEKVMSIFFAPWKSKKHGTYGRTVQKAARDLICQQKMAQLHQIPVISIEWPTDQNYEVESKLSISDKALKKLVRELIKIKFDYKKSNEIKILQRKMTLKIPELYQLRPPSIKIVKTEEYVKKLKKKYPKIKLTKCFQCNTKTIIYNIGMTEKNCRREDPYGGTQFCYDYTECRSGVQVTEKHTNLVLRLPKIKTVVWKQKNANDPKLKRSIWYATANLIELKDGIIIAKSKVGKSE